LDFQYRKPLCRCRAFLSITEVHQCLQHRSTSPKSTTPVPPLPGTDIKEIAPLNHPFQLETLVSTILSEANMQQFIRLANLGIKTDLPEVCRLLQNDFNDPEYTDPEDHQGWT
jgi:hypothetical protein